MSEKHKGTYKYLHYVEETLILVSRITRYVSISAFDLLACVSVGITSSALWIKACAIMSRMKTYKSIIKENKKKHDKIVLLGKDKLKTIEVLFSKALIDPNISHDDFFFVNNSLRDERRKSWEFCGIWKRIALVVKPYCKCKIKFQKN